MYLVFNSCSMWNETWVSRKLKKSVTLFLVSSKCMDIFFSSDKNNYSHSELLIELTGFELLLTLTNDFRKVNSLASWLIDAYSWNYDYIYKRSSILAHIQQLVWWLAVAMNEEKCYMFRSSEICWGILYQSKSNNEFELPSMLIQYFKINNNIWVHP